MLRGESPLSLLPSFAFRAPQFDQVFQKIGTRNRRIQIKHKNKTKKGKKIWWVGLVIRVESADLTWKSKVRSLREDRVV